MMSDKDKTKTQFISQLGGLCRQITRIEPLGIMRAHNIGIGIRE